MLLHTTRDLTRRDESTSRIWEQQLYHRCSFHERLECPRHPWLWCDYRALRRLAGSTCENCRSYGGPCDALTQQSSFSPGPVHKCRTAATPVRGSNRSSPAEVAPPPANRRHEVVRSATRMPRHNP